MVIRVERLLALGAAFLFCGLASAAAQTAPQSVAPGQIEKRFEAPAPLKAPSGPVIPAIEGQVAPQNAKDVRFTLGAVVVEGSTAFPEAEFVPLYENLLAREVSLADIFAVASAITAKYEEQGYILSRAIVPEQQVSLGIVRIRVVEGYIDNVVFRGDVRGSTDLLKAYAEKITNSAPLRRDALERYILLMNDLAGVTATRELVPSQTDPGAYTLIVTLRHAAVQGFVRADNRGSRYVGPLQGWADVGFNSLFGRYENTHLRYVTTAQPSELQYVELDHTENVGSEGTKVALTGSLSRAEPGFTLKSRDIDSRGSQLGVSVSHPLIRSQRTDLFLSARFDAGHFERDESGAEVFDDHLRVVRAGARFGYLDGWNGRNQLSFELSQGLSILGASDGASSQRSRAGADAEFSKGVVNVSRYQPLAPDWAVLATATGQKAAQKLLLSEQIGLGGEGFGRAYDPSEITGDDGAAVRFELQRDGAMPGSFVPQYEFYAYYDGGMVWSRGTDPDHSLASAGVGVRFLTVGDLLASIELAQPITRAVEAMGTKGKDPRVFFTLTRSF